MDQLFVANYNISSAVLADPRLSVNLSVDPVSLALRGHATVIVGEARRERFDVEGSYMALDGLPGVLTLRNTPSRFAVMCPPVLELLIALPDGWKSGKASFVYTYGQGRTDARVNNAVATLCASHPVNEMH